MIYRLTFSGNMPNLMAMSEHVEHDTVPINKFSRNSDDPEGLLLTRVIIFSSPGKVILENPLHIGLIDVLLLIQTVLIFFIACIAAKLLKRPHDIAAGAGMIG